MASKEARVRIGIGSYTFPRSVASGRKSVDSILEFAQTYGMGAVQFCENLPWPSARALPVGLVLETGCRGIGPHLLEHLALAQETGSGFVRLVIDTADDHPSAEEAVDRLRPFATRYEEAGVVLAIENHDRFPAKVLKKMVTELKAGVVLDTANSLGCLEDLETVVQEVGEYVVNLHTKDVKAIRKPDLLGFDVVGETLGEGQVNFQLLTGRLPQLKSVTLEQWLPEEQEIPAAEVGIVRLKEWFGA